MIQTIVSRHAPTVAELIDALHNAVRGYGGTKKCSWAPDPTTPGALIVYDKDGNAIVTVTNVEVNNGSTPV